MGKKNPSFAKMVCEALRTVDHEHGMNSKMILDFIKEKYSVEGDDKSNLNLIHKELERGKTSTEYLQVQGNNIHHGHFTFNTQYVHPSDKQQKLPDYMNPPELYNWSIETTGSPKQEKRRKTLAEYAKDLSGSSIKCRLALIYLNKEFIESADQHQEAVKLGVIPNLIKCVSIDDLECTDFALSCLLLLCEEDIDNCKLFLGTDIAYKMYELLFKTSVQKIQSSTIIIASKLSSLLRVIIEYMECAELKFKKMDFVNFSLCVWYLAEHLDEFGFHKLAEPLLYMMNFATKTNYRLLFRPRRISEMHETLMEAEGVKLMFLSAVFIQILPTEIPKMLQNGLANKLFKFLETTENADYLQIALYSMGFSILSYKMDFRANCDKENVKILYPFLSSKDKNICTPACLLFKTFVLKFEDENDLSSTVSLIYPAFNDYAALIYKKFGRHLIKLGSGFLVEVEVTYT